jgi:GTP cyclohydrolase I
MENGKVDRARIAELTTELLKAIGEDPTRSGLVDTPRRVADFWGAFIDYDAGRTDTAFETTGTDQMVVVSGLRVWSLCEHHLLPFWCDVSIGYIARDKVLGLSKFARIAKARAHGLQIQEGLVEQIAADVRAKTGTDDVAVVASGEHLCMTMRGAETPHRMISSSIHGLFKTAETRAEFMSLAGVGRSGRCGG